MNCPLCKGEKREAISGPDRRDFFWCPHCQLIASPPRDHLNMAEARQRYSQHRNGPEFPGYVDFLNQIITPTLPYLDPAMRGIDYGCGPNPTLSHLLRQQGLRCDDYDLIFFPDVPTPPYDFIFSTECFEHFAAPHADIAQLVQLLKSGGYLAIMTLLWTTHEDFPTWFYARDPTHLCFYHAETLDWMSRAFGLQPIWSDQTRCFLFQKQAT